MKWTVEICARVCHHLDLANMKLRAGRVAISGILPSQMIRYDRRRQPSLSYHSIFDGMAYIHQLKRPVHIVQLPFLTTRLHAFLDHYLEICSHSAGQDHFAGCGTQTQLLSITSCALRLSCQLFQQTRSQEKLILRTEFHHFKAKSLSQPLHLGPINRGGNVTFPWSRQYVVDKLMSTIGSQCSPRT